MFRFYVNKKENNRFILDDKILNHIKVVRILNKDFICIYEGKFYICNLIEKTNMAQIKSELGGNHDYKSEVILSMSLIKNNKFELVIQKAAELGVTKLIPTITKNVSIKVSDKLKRWNEIAINASEQAFRNKPLEILPIMKIKDVLSNFTHIKNKYVAHEKNDKQIINRFLDTNCIVLIGPEGGFTKEEILDIQKDNYELINLGDRILRSETAAIYVLSHLREY